MNHSEILESVIVAGAKLVDSVSFDVNGVNGRGGNGGLTSTDTVRASDELRLAIDRARRALSTPKGER